MDDHMHIVRRVALLPDEELTRLLDAINGSNTPAATTKRETRTEYIEQISRELQARGIFGPPWWSSARG